MMKHRKTVGRQSRPNWRGQHISHDPPHWWPEGEPWPPSTLSLRRDRRRLLPRALLIAFAVLLFSTILCSGGVFFLSTLLRGIRPPTASLGLGLGATLVVLIAGVAMIAHTLRRFFSPLDALLNASEQVAEGDLSVRVPERGTPEVRALTKSFNDMVQRLSDETQERRDLLADVSHELRTPLTVMQGEIEGMLDDLYPRDEAHLRDLLEETKQLSNLVEDLRTLALAERGALPIHKETTDLAQLVGETLASFRTRAETQGVELALVSHEDLPFLFVDPLRIRQVLHNVLTNALRYATAGDEVNVEIRRAGTDNVCIKVQDSGSGIPADVLPYIFDRFYKSADSEGSGLGLAIAKQLIEAHGGGITAESTVGVGTTILITLPS